MRSGSLIQFILIYCLILPSLPAAASDNSPQEAAAPALSLALESMFVPPLARYRNSREIFRIVYFSPILTHEFDAAIAQNPKLRDLARAGKSYRREFIDMAIRIFGENNAPLALSPYYTAANWLQTIIRSEVRSAENPISEQEARAQAVEDTVIKFGLPVTYTSSDIDSRRNDDARHRNAYDYFTRRFYVLLDRTDQQDKPLETSVEQFKKRLTNRIYTVMAQNFQHAALQWLNMSGQSLRVVNALHKNEVLPLGSAQEISVVPLSYAPADSEISQRSGWVNGHLQWLKNLVSWYGSRLKKNDARYARIAYSHVTINAAKPIFKYIIKGSQNGESRHFVLSAVEIESALEFIHTNVKSANQPGLANALMSDAYARNKVLTDFLLDLNARQDTTLDKLRARLLRLSAEHQDINGSTLAFRLIKYEQDYVRDDSMTDLRWFGYMKGDSYWEVRDAAAMKAKMPALKLNKTNPTDFSPPPLTTLNFKQRRIQRKETQFAVARASPNSRRAAILAKRRIKQAIISALLWSLVSSASSDRLSNAAHQILPHLQNEIHAHMPWLSDEIAKGLHNVPMPKLLKKLGAFIEAHRAPPISLDDQSKAQNVYLDRDSMLQGNAAPVFKISGYNGHEIPLYLDLVTKENLRHFKSVPLDQTDEPKNDAFYLKSITGVFAKDGIIPIPSPNGYIVNSMDLNQGGATLLPNRDYQIEIEPQIGLMYIKLSPQWAKRATMFTKFSYQIDYQKNEKVDTRFINNYAMNNRSIADTNAELAAIGATNVTKTVGLDIKMHLTFLDIIESSFRSTGYYNYDGYSATPDSRLDTKNPFYKYAKFLDHGNFRYQCTGSNHLFNTYFNEYLRHAQKNGVETPVRLEMVQGFVYEGGKYVRVPGHFHNIAYQVGHDYSYEVSDITPYSPDIVKQPDVTQNTPALSEKIDHLIHIIGNIIAKANRNVVEPILSLKSEIRKIMGQSSAKKTNGANVHFAQNAAFTPFRPPNDVSGLPAAAEIRKKADTRPKPTLYLANIKPYAGSNLKIIAKVEPTNLPEAPAEIPFQKQIEDILAKRAALNLVIKANAKRFQILNQPQKFPLTVGLDNLARAQMVIEMLSGRISKDQALFKIFLLDNKVLPKESITELADEQLHAEFKQLQSLPANSSFETLIDRADNRLKTAIDSVASGSPNSNGKEFLLDPEIADAIINLSRSIRRGLNAATQNCTTILKN